MNNTSNESISSKILIFEKFPRSKQIAFSGKFLSKILFPHSLPEE